MKSWRTLFAPRIYQRGQEYFKHGDVSQLRINSSGEFSAIVQGRCPYYVTGKSREGVASNLTCTCPYAQDHHRCKHMAAVLIAIDKQLLEKGPRATLNDVFRPSFDTSRLPIDPAKLIGHIQFPKKLLQDVLINIEQLEVEAEELINAQDYLDPASEIEWCYLLSCSFAGEYFSVRVEFNRHSIVNITTGPTDTAHQIVAKILALYQLMNYLVKHNILEGTNEAAKLMLDNFFNNNEDSPINQQPMITAHIGDYYEGGFYLYFRVGIPGHMYKVQNIMTLVRHIDWGENIQLGKFFDQPIFPESLDNSSKEWLKFIFRLVSVADLINNSYSEPILKNEFPLAENIADEVDKILQAGGKLEGNYGVSIIRQEQELHPTVTVKAHGNNDDPHRQLTVTIDQQNDLIKGEKSYYQLTQNTWQAFTGVVPHELDRFFPTGQDLTFGTDTMTEFYQQVLPQLQNKFAVELPQNCDLSAFLPKVPTSVFLLDYHDQMIECKLALKIKGQTKRFTTVHFGDGVSRFLLNKIDRLIQTYFPHFDSQTATASVSLNDGQSFLTQGIDKFRQAGIVKATTAFNRLAHQPLTKMNVGVSIDSGLLKLDVSGDKLTSAEIQKILANYQPHKKYYQLSNTKTINIDEPSVDALVQLMQKLNLTPQEFTRGKLSLPAYRAIYLDELLSRQQALTYHSTGELRQMIADLQAPEKDLRLPSNLQAKLRPYQQDGVQWLMTLAKYHLGGLLADEMGLGKTLEVITVLLNEQGKGQNLVIAPASVIYNWRDELKKFAPDLQVTVLDGSKAKRRSQLAEGAKSDVIVTSYDAAKRDMDLYDGQHFNVEVIDEAQYIKNPKTAAAKTVKAIDAAQRFALTGTPIENRLSELWSIFDFLMPGLLGSYKEFRQQFEQPIVRDHNEKVQAELKRLVQPFMLRRLKQDVLQDLPAKEEQVLLTPMIGQQAKLYQAHAQRLINQIEGQDEETFRQSKLAILGEITRLRELCCSPQLLDEEYRGHSGKVDTTMQLVKSEIAGNHKILLFSQFTSVLKIFQDKLTRAGIQHFLIEGKIDKASRLQAVDEFNRLESPAVFLISLKAGGTGLNLTSADVVIHFDPWWNIAAENQATDRAHRIGQKNNVTIYKMIAQDTIEEKIIEMQKKKATMANSILAGKEVANSTLDRGTLLRILK